MSQIPKKKGPQDQMKQKRLVTMKGDLKTQKTKSKPLVPGQFFFSHFEQLGELYTKSSTSFGSVANMKKQAVYRDPMLSTTFKQKPLTQNTNSSQKHFHC